MLRHWPSHHLHLAHGIRLWMVPCLAHGSDTLPCLIQVWAQYGPRRHPGVATSGCHNPPICHRCCARQWHQPLSSAHQFESTSSWNSDENGSRRYDHHKGPPLHSMCCPQCVATQCYRDATPCFRQCQYPFHPQCRRQLRHRSTPSSRWCSAVGMWSLLQTGQRCAHCLQSPGLHSKAHGCRSQLQNRLCSQRHPKVGRHKEGCCRLGLCMWHR